jgi:hypothetical protein
MRYELRDLFTKTGVLPSASWLVRWGFHWDHVKSLWREVGTCDGLPLNSCVVCQQTNSEQKNHNSFLKSPIIGNETLVYVYDPEIKPEEYHHHLIQISLSQWEEPVRPNIDGTVHRVFTFQGQTVTQHYDTFSVASREETCGENVLRNGAMEIGFFITTVLLLPLLYLRRNFRPETAWLLSPIL